MPEFRYAVTATLPDHQTLAEYLAWLTEGHLQGVIEGGAHSAEAIMLDDADTLRVESRYAFASKSDFDRYEADHAPALRADGAARFGTRGVLFERVTGTLHASVQR